MKFGFVADTNLFTDAFLVSVTAVGHKSELGKHTTMGCGLRLRKTQHMVVFCCPPKYVQFDP